MSYSEIIGKRFGRWTVESKHGQGLLTTEITNRATAGGRPALSREETYQQIDGSSTRGENNAWLTGAAKSALMRLP